MAWIYEVLEVTDRRGTPLGRYRVVKWNATTPDELHGLCTHHHTDHEEALNCPVANEVLEFAFTPDFRFRPAERKPS